MSLTTEPDSRPRLKALRAEGVWQGQMKTRLQVRDFAPFYTGEPERVGGDDSAPTPMEYVVAALNGCVAVVVETVAAELGLRIDGMRIESEATMDRRGFLGTADVTPHFTQLTNRIRFTTTEQPERLEELQRQVVRRCPALNLVQDAGVPVTLDWSVEEVRAS
jgi:uncharacterized OsmC-like protein